MKYQVKIPTRILGVGNALVDIMIALPDDHFLIDFGLPRGSMTLVDNDQSENIFEATKAYRKEVTTGGSAANTIHALASLGVDCGYAGKVGNDELGEVFSSEFHKKNIKTHLFPGNLNTGRVMAMVSPDSERTMATYLGAAADLYPTEFTQELTDLYDILYVEGYLVQNHDLIKTILQRGYESGLKVAIDLSSFNIVAQNLEFLKKIVKDYVHIVFANEEEALSFTGKDPEQAIREIAELCDLAIVKTGKSGSLAMFNGEMIRHSPVTANAIDTTGAGDTYAAGFLYGLTHGLDLQQCGDIASFVASRVVEYMGAKIPDNEWNGILEKVKSIERRISPAL
ncbi:MAG TPA: adenosine kinase [Prolixibacteraceae bacterium]|nr:adenosine kinase [Prolixibacteraceae bacterium]